MQEKETKKRSTSSKSGMGAKIDGRVRNPPTVQKGKRPPLAWTAEEYTSRHRWWWFIGVGVVGLYLAAFLILAGQASAAALAFVSTLALIVFGVAKPRSWHYSLDGRTLRIDGKTRVRSISFSWNLDDFNCMNRPGVPPR